MPAPKIIQFPPQEKSSGGGKPRNKNRADGRYQVKAYYTDPATGQRKEKFFYGKTQSEAQAKKKEFQDLLATGADPVALKITVSEYVEKWLALRALKDQGRKTDKTYNGYVREAKRLTDALGAKPLRQVTRSDLQAVIYSRSGMADHTIRITYNAIAQIFRAALGDRLITHNPMADLDRPVGESGSHRAIDPWERDLILSSWQHHRLGLMGMLMLFAGLRRGEACALLWEDIDFDSGIIHVRQALSFISGRSIRGDTKTDAGQRDVPILAPLRPVLDRFRKSSGPVCVSASGAEQTESACRRGWDSYMLYLSCLHSGIKYPPPKDYKKSPTWQPVSIQMHDLRHSYCTMLYDAGVDVKTAQLLMGHSSVEVTMKIYTHLSNTRKLQSLDALHAFAAALPHP